MSKTANFDTLSIKLSMCIYMYYGWQLLSRGGAANAPSCPPLNVPLVVEDVRHWVSEAHSFGANDWDG